MRQPAASARRPQSSGASRASPLPPATGSSGAVTYDFGAGGVIAVVVALDLCLWWVGRWARGGDDGRARNRGDQDDAHRCLQAGHLGAHRCAARRPRPRRAGAERVPPGRGPADSAPGVREQR